MPLLDCVFAVQYNSAIPPFCHSAILLPFLHSVIPPFYCRSAIPPCCHSRIVLYLTSVFYWLLGGIVNNNISTFYQYFVMIVTYIMNRVVPLSMYVGIGGLRRIKISLLIRSPRSAPPLFLMFIPYDVHHECDGVRVLKFILFVLIPSSYNT